LAVTPAGKRPLGKPRCRWLYNIKIYLGEIEWGAMYWIDLGHDMDQWWALVNMVMNLHDQLSFHFKFKLHSSQHVTIHN
jgi:hypothetical protein